MQEPPVCHLRCFCCLVQTLCSRLSKAARQDPIDTQQLRQFLEQQNVSKCFDPLFSGGVRQIGDIWNIDAEVLKNLEITPIARKKLTNVIETRTKVSSLSDRCSRPCSSEICPGLWQSEAKFRKWGDKLTQHLVNPNSVLWPNEVRFYGG